MTLNDWIDVNLKLLCGRTLRVIDSNTRKGIGDMMMFYMDKEVKSVKVTSKFIFVFI